MIVFTAHIDESGHFDQRDVRQAMAAVLLTQDGERVAELSLSSRFGATYPWIPWPLHASVIRTAEAQAFWIDSAPSSMAIDRHLHHAARTFMAAIEREPTGSPLKRWHSRVQGGEPFRTFRSDARLARQSLARRDPSFSNAAQTLTSAGLGATQTLDELVRELLEFLNKDARVYLAYFDGSNVDSLALGDPWLAMFAVLYERIRRGESNRCRLRVQRRDVRDPATGTAHPFHIRHAEEIVRRIALALPPGDPTASRILPFDGIVALDRTARAGDVLADLVSHHARRLASTLSGMSWEDARHRLRAEIGCPMTRSLSLPVVAFEGASAQRLFGCANTAEVPVDPWAAGCTDAARHYYEGAP